MSFQELYDLSGKTAVVTGGAGGIGLEAARALAGCGASIVLVDQEKDSVDEAVNVLSKEGANVSAAIADVTVPSTLDACARKLESQGRNVDILVNSAGITRLNTALDTSDSEWREVLDVNVNGTYWACRAFGRLMVENECGSIVNLGSMSGIIVNRPQNAASYMTSKGAVHMLTKALAVEWASFGVRVNAVAPGYVATEMTEKMRARPELFDVWMEMTPMGRCGYPREIASSILYLASPASSYVTGTILSIDGGYTSW